MDEQGLLSPAPGTSEEPLPPPPPPSPPAAEPKRSNVCAVCGAVSEHFYLNYGAAACFSCRAFFRRANINLKGDRDVINPRAMVCKNGGRCEVTVVNRKCRRCRYDRCLGAGMNPSAVLDDDGKKVRFRKMLKKKMMQPEEVRTSELTKSGRAKPWTKSKLTLGEGELEPPKKRGRKPKERPTREILQPSPPSSLSYPTSLEEREQRVPDIPPLVALAPRSLERAVRLQVEQNGGYAAAASSAEANSAAAATYESRFHGYFMNGHFMDYSRFGAASYGEVERSHSGYSNHGCESQQPAGSSFGCGTSSNNFNGPANPYVKREDNLDLLPIATSAVALTKSDASFLPEIKVEDENTDEPSIEESNSSDDQFMVKSEVLEVLREDDLAELNQNSEVESLSRNGRISIHFRSSSKPELFFLLQDEINGDSKTDCVLMTQRTSRRGSVRKEMISKLQNYQKAWNLALRSMVITEPLLEGLLGLHRGSNVLTKEMLKVHFVALAKLFTDFACLHPVFCRLTKLDQRKCLTMNVGMFIQYILCRYFGSVKNGAKDQINWMLVSKLQTTLGNENLDPINLENFNSSLKILEWEKVPEYQSTIDEAARLAEKFETRNNCTLALCFLFNVPIATHLNDPEALDDLRSDIHILVDWASEVYGSPGRDDIVALTSALERMKDVFDANTSWDTTDTVHSISLWQQITLPYCAEEELWTLQRFSLFQKAFHEVELGGDILNEFIYFSHDVPISKQFMPRAMAVFAERFRNLLRRMEEFSLLSPGQKKRALETCVFHSVAIFVAKIESCENGYQQLRFAVGSEGEDLTYTRDILSIVDARKLKKMCMANVNPTTGNLDPEAIQRFAFLLGKVIPLVRDLEAMKLMVFVLLFNETAEDGDQICVAIQQRYLTLLWRRLAHLKGSSGAQDEFGGDLSETNDGSFEMFRSGMAHIKELSVIMHRLAMQKRDETPQQLALK